MTRRLKDPVLEKYLAGAMDEVARQAVDKTLAESPQDAERLKELQVDSAAFLTLHPPGAFAARVLKEQTPWWRRPMLWLPLVAGAAAAVAVMIRPSEPELLTKGAVTLVLHRKSASGSEVVGAGHALRSGDALRFQVRSGAPGFTAIFSKDASGLVTLAPRDAQAAPSETILEDAVTLDDAPGPETFIVVWAPKVFEVEHARQVLAGGRAMKDAIAGAVVAERFVEKQRSPSNSGGSSP
jgi:hypothetical protein